MTLEQIMQEMNLLKRVFELTNGYLYLRITRREYLDEMHLTLQRLEGTDREDSSVQV